MMREKKIVISFYCKARSLYCIFFLFRKRRGKEIKKKYNINCLVKMFSAEAPVQNKLLSRFHDTIIIHSLSNSNTKRNYS